MHILDSRNTWSYSQGFNMMVDFCIWVLMADGLHVPPFDQHPDGDGSLRAAGLDAASWQAWLIRVVNLQYEQQQLGQQRASKNSLDAQVEPNSWFLPEAIHPPIAWKGNDAVGNRLEELWKQYGPTSKYDA